MIIAVVCKNELVKLGEFPGVEEAREVYGEQTEILGFTDQAEFDEFDQVVRDVRSFTQMLELITAEKL